MLVMKKSIYVWHIIYPICIYHIVLLSVILLSELVLGNDVESYMKCQILGTLATLPVMYLRFYKMNESIVGVRKEKTAAIKKQLILSVSILTVAGCIGVGFGNLLTMSPLSSYSKGFAEANEHFYGSTLWIEIIGSAILTPVLEELLYRGILYERLKFIFEKKWQAVLISSLIFALVHFNLVQFIYAFGMGIVLAMCMEITDHVYGAILAHMIANFLAVIRTECGLWQQIGDGSVLAWISSGALFLAGVVILIIVYRKKDRQSK